MMARPGVAFSRIQLLEDVWDFAWDGDSPRSRCTSGGSARRSKTIRRDPTRLVTVWGVGYRFEP